jgi:hypothetical protein
VVLDKVPRRRDGETEILICYDGTDEAGHAIDVAAVLSSARDARSFSTSRRC